MTAQSPIVKALEQFELERANLLARVAKLDALIAQTRDVFHLPNGTRAIPERAARNKNDPKSDQKRSSGNGNGHGTLSADAIRAALKGGPLSPGKLAEQLGVERAALMYHVNQLAMDKVVVLSGVTAGRRVALAPHKTAKEVP